MKLRRESLLVFVLLLTMLAHVLDFVIMMPLGPKLMRGFDISASQFGYIVAVYTVAAAVSSFVGTAWIDKLNRKTALLSLLIGFIFGNFVCAWAPNSSWLVMGRILAGLFGGVMNAVIYSIVGQVVRVETRGRAAGWLGTSFPIVSIAGVPIGLKIADIYGWRAAFILVIALSLISFVLSLIVLPSIKPEVSAKNEDSFLTPMRSALKLSRHKWGIVLIVMAVFGGFTIVPYIAPFLVNNKFITEDQLYLVYLVGGSCAIFSSRLIGIFSDRYGKVVLLRVTCVMTILALAIFTNLPQHSLYLVLAVMSFAMMSLPGRFVCIMAWMTIISDPKNRGAFMSLISTVQQLTIGLAALVGGALVGEAHDGSLQTFWLAGLFAITFNLGILLISPRLNRLEKASLETRHPS